MRTTLNIDDDLLSTVMQLNKGKTRSQAIRDALEAYVKQKKKEQVLALRGKVDLDEGWRELRELEKKEI